ncbi:hypothetical protein A3I27_00665 [Candidatus Giovannonibacteria bacterium RIFCSPLOWO2_02_FULL_43_11b]|uniref:Uncharacterized protein n=1 Tax=Candidatus Giovannonibacteria bacterium RIFCSPHIGHO2_12_FULL_43_15 TaxID=1798341 RepID=A0A1F5WPJ8_9BACT|nr:MAG: hypothetical protein A3B97_01355 [Candidatus Giovannonibacteria bacterium RIFCSPHIGHO2_02_FULL_43_32]OGF77602.1 MAG: hypothetical protein A3F23_00150 [Candidatus Giovannonibacteria bacterium RIFCSPHIGHO2_12_FULL_43_15]OGF79281.1 MAG: hypothetical protein A3A15_01425 [Candidatus Giovannonibacteria bacterium RIFCSPLOWO2_01_FULL_43_60]OGF90166.1 MAG: hypothetical protein A3I27_00665 [Candidatus Giovannonibacteria bacterium RIFCSPLOWO2_02_FULL_43_11b]OGF92240.1 MAG: hypothetical protein A3H
MKIFVKAKPNSPPSLKLRRTSESKTIYLVSVKEAPKDGRANIAIQEALAEHFGVAPSRVRLVSGFSSRNKVFEVL